MSRFAVVTLGSVGDLHPFLGVARALVQAGQEVHLLGQAPYRAAVEAEGVRFVEIVDARTHRRTLAHPKLWHPVDGLGVLWRHLAVPAIEPTLYALAGLGAAPDARRGAGLTVLASPLAAGARLAKARWPDHVRLLTGYTAPTGLRQIGDPLFMGAWQVPPAVPGWARHGLWRLLDRWKLEPMARPALAQWTQRLSTPALSGSIFGDWLHSPDGGVTLYPDRFAAVPEAWADRRVREGAFPMFRPAQPAGLPAQVQQFLARGKPFAVLYAGSAAGRHISTLGPTVQALRGLGLRVLQIGAFLQDDPGGAPAMDGLGDAVLRTGPLAWHEVLPRAQLIVHHGGIGTVAEAWAAQVPQLMLPVAFDQFDNAERARGLGLGDWLAPRRRSADAIAAAAARCLALRPPVWPRDQSGEAGAHALRQAGLPPGA